MATVVQIMQIMFYGVATLFMICFMIIGIWSFILYIKKVNNSRIQTFLLKKINDNIATLSNTRNNAEYDDAFTSSDSFLNEPLFEKGKDNNSETGNGIYNIK